MDQHRSEYAGSTLDEVLEELEESGYRTFILISPDNTFLTIENPQDLDWFLCSDPSLQSARIVNCAVNEYAKCATIAYV